MTYDHREAGFPADELAVALLERAGVRDRRKTAQRQILWWVAGRLPRPSPRTACTRSGDTW
jgi:hypothetical protein